MYIGEGLTDVPDADREREPEFMERYKQYRVNSRARGLRPYPLRDLHRYDVNRLGQSPLPPQSPGVPPWVLWLALGLLVWFLLRGGRS